MTLGEFREQTKGMSDDLELEFYSERYNDSTQPKYLEFEPEGYIEFIIDDDRWDLVDKKNTIPIPEEATNGDVFNTLFDIDKDIEEIEGKDGYMYFTIRADAWNTPYKAESEDKE